MNFYLKTNLAFNTKTFTGLPHTVNSGKLYFNFFLNSGKLKALLIFSKNFREVLRLKKSQGNFFLH